MHKILLISLVLIVSNANAQIHPVDNGSSVQFKVRNLGFGVTGSFTGIDGKINFDPNKIQDATFDVSIDANTVNTGMEMRDNHLRKETYFDVEKYPRIKIESKEIAASNKKGQLVFSGKVLIKNQSKDISFPFTAEPVNGGYLFKGSFKVNRKELGIGGTSTISDEVEIALSVFAK